MSFQPSGSVTRTLSQTPSRAPQQQSQSPAPQSLSIRTSVPPTQNAPNSARSSPPTQQQRPYPTYPIAIPPDKFQRAVELFGKHRLAKGLGQRDRALSGQPYLSVPHHERPPSVGSHTSSGPQTPSLSASTFGAGTTESVLSFDDNESPSSAVANASSEFTAYDGRRVRPRQRNRLSPEAKAKAALIRHLGSCWVCRSRRVPCPLEHHDIDALEAGLRNARPLRSVQPPQDAAGVRPRSQTQPDLTRPMGTMVSDSVGVGRSQSQRDRQPMASYNQNVSLIGLGQQPSLLNFNFNELENSHSPVFADNLMDPLASINAMSQYTSYQDGHLLPLGVSRGYFFSCQHLGGNCQELFNDPEELQTHFETAHFAFTRLDPAYRYHCQGCKKMTSQNGPCSGCGLIAAKEIWIYGGFIRVPSYDRYDPDGQDFFTTLEDPFLDSAYSPGLSPGAGLGQGNNGGFNLNFDNFDPSFYQNNNTYQAPGPGRGDNYDGYNPQQGGFQFQGHQLEKEVDVTPMPPMSIWFSQLLQACRRHKLILIAISLLLAAALAIKTHDWFIAKGRSIHVYANLPFIGFIGLLASCVICLAYWSTGHQYFTPTINSQRQLSCPRFPINDFGPSASTMSFGPAAPRAASLIRSDIAL